MDIQSTSPSLEIMKVYKCPSRDEAKELEQR